MKPKFSQNGSDFVISEELNSRKYTDEFRSILKQLKIGD